MTESVHEGFMRLALRLAQNGYGCTSPNPMVGAVLVKRGQIIGQGWHRRAGEPHAEIEAIRAAQKRGLDPKGAALYVTLEPCSTFGRTPPCTAAIMEAGIREVIVAATDPNPAHRGRGLHLLKKADLSVTTGVLAEEAGRLNEAFNRWIVHRTPFVTVKAAMTLDAKIATASGESKWITGPKARAYAMHLRQGSDAVLVGINTIVVDDPQLTMRAVSMSRTPSPRPSPPMGERVPERFASKRLRRIVLDTKARTPLSARVIADDPEALTTIVVGENSPRKRVLELSKRVSVIVAPEREEKIDLRWLLKELGKEEVTSLLVEGGGEVNAAFLLGKLAQRVAFFYSPKILCGRDSTRGVAGDGIGAMKDVLGLKEVEYRWLGADLLMTALLE